MVENMALKVAFPKFYGIACAKGTNVVAHLELFGGPIQWNVNFARVAYD
jgi:uncharacterized protein YaaW (UPF0174 family)